MPNHRLLAIALASALTGLSACGSSTETTATTTTTAAATTEVETDDLDDETDETDDSSGLDAHEHGSAEMTVAWIDNDVVIDLTSPTDNVFGFEYEPETDEDIAIATEQTNALTAEGTITINDEASCALAEPVSTEVTYEGSHAEIVASWMFTCENPDDITLVDATELFSMFPNFVDIDAEWISATDQSSAELSPEAPTLALKS